MDKGDVILYVYYAKDILRAPGYVGGRPATLNALKKDLKQSTKEQIDIEYTVTMPGEILSHDIGTRNNNSVTFDIREFFKKPSAKIIYEERK